MAKKVRANIWARVVVKGFLIKVDAALQFLTLTPFSLCEHGRRKGCQGWGLWTR